jgi:hypothetical protein
VCNRGVTKRTFYVNPRLNEAFKVAQPLPVLLGSLGDIEQSDALPRSATQDLWQAGSASLLPVQSRAVESMSLNSNRAS